MREGREGGGKVGQLLEDFEWTTFVLTKRFSMPFADSCSALVRWLLIVS